MAIKNKNRQKKQNSPKNDDQQKSKNLEGKIEATITENQISETEIKKVESEVTTPEQVTYKSAQELYHKIAAVKKVFEKRKDELEKLKAQVELEKGSIEKEKKENNQLKTDLKIRLTKYNDELIEINKLQVEGGFASVIDRKLLNSYTDQLKNQEEILLKKIEALKIKHTEYIDALTTLNTKELALEKDFQEKLSQEKIKLKEEFKTKFREKENNLEVLKEKLSQKQRELQQKRKEFNYDLEDFNDEKEYLVNKAKTKVKEEITDLENQIENLKEKNNSLIQELERLKNELKYLAEYGDAKTVIDLLRDKIHQIAELNSKLELSPDVLKVDELKRLQIEKNDWQDKIRETETQLNDYKTKYNRQKLQIGEKEALELEKEALEARIKLQQTAFDELKEEVNELTKQTEDKTTFVNCTEMDNKYKKALDNISKNIISKDWIENIQQAIAQVTDNKLFYNKDILRSFIAGLAMSRFSILQGISGTGKTSLPKAFAKAIGGNFGIVEVQSGWKDRQDLIGYYNTFEKKYYEGEFMKLLYMAGTPQYKDNPFFIILDEMNLSHPEHYFADMLSIMEETDTEKQILKISDKVKDIPQLMTELETGGIGLKIPQNVWFIGTANHDETTLQFAPKTYDRANILEMPINIDTFPIKNIDLNKVTVSNANFLSFLKIKKEDKKNEKLENYLDGNFKDICNKLGLGWGNRLKKQIKLFIPIFEKLDGNTANAFDHIIASKILRSVKGRYDLQEATLTEMKEELENHFKTTFNGDAKKSLAIIETELSRLNN